MSSLHYSYIFTKSHSHSFTFNPKAELVERIHNNTFPANEESYCYFRARLLQEANPHYVVIIGSLGYVQPYGGRVFWAYG